MASSPPVPSPYPPKVAFFLTSLDGGGAERVMLNLAAGFQARGFAVDLILGKSVGPYLKQIPPGVQLIDLQQSRLLGCLQALARYLRREQPPALISALEDTNLVAIASRALARRRCKTLPTRLLVTVHNHLGQEVKHATQLKRRWVPYILRWFYPHADIVVGVSQGVVASLGQFGCSRRNAQTIYNPIVTPALRQRLGEPLEHPWVGPGQPPLVLAVGRLTAQKDFATLLRAFALVRSDRPARLILLGEGEDRPALEQLAQHLGISADIALPGFVDNPFAYMAQAQVLVMSSAWEGFGNVLVEAMAAGTPVVSTDCESGPREILRDGQDGPLVPVGDAAAIAQAILATLDNPPPAAALRQRAEAFALDTVVGQYQACLGLADPQ